MTLLIGDSIGLSMTEELSWSQIEVNAEVGRQFSTGLEVVWELASEGLLPKRIVIELGTNGPIDPDDLFAMRHMLMDSKVWWVNNYAPGKLWQTPNNHMLKDITGDNLIRWKALAVKHPEWFTTDPMHIHPDANGQKALAALITRRVG